MRESVLAIYIEPAPYVTGLIKEVRAAWPGKLDVAFIARNLTQAWAIEGSDNHQMHFLPPKAGGAVREIWRRLSARDYDLVHLAGWGHPVLLGSMLAARTHGIPIVAETDTPSPSDERTWRRLAKKIIYPALLGLPRQFLPAGTRQASYLKMFGVPEERIQIGQMTVDVDRIGEFARVHGPCSRTTLRRQLKIADDAVVFLFLGRLEVAKGLQDLFDAYVRLRTERSDIALLIAGSGSSERFAREAADAVRSVHFAGHLSGEQVWRAYCAADVFVLPTHRDSWGLAISEAMAAGLPVIVSDAAGCIDDLVRSGATGLVHQSRDSASLLSAMRRLAGDPAARLEMGAAGQQLISSWTLAEQARRVVSAWQKVIQ